jgi:hypothetical protein
MKYFTYLIVFLSFNLNAQNKYDIDSITIGLKLENDTIKVGEPLYYTISLKNNSSSSKKTSKLWQETLYFSMYPTLEYQRSPDSMA